MAFTLVDLSGGVGAGGGGEIVINLELQEKTVDSSTNIQHVKPTDGYIGLKEVTVNPVELQNKTVDSSTVSQEIVPDASVTGLNKVTVNPYVLDEKTVDSSTVAQEVTSDVDGLSKVTINPLVLSPLELDSSTAVQESEGLYNSVRVNPYVLDSKTVDSSTVSQTVVSDVDGLSQVVVNPYTLDNLTLDSSTISQSVEGQYGNVTVNPYVLDSKTVDSSTVSQTVVSDEDGLSSVTVNPYVLDEKTVNSSTNEQEITSDADGLSKVTINPYVLDSKTVDSSTVSQTVVSDEDGLSSVTVNPYTLDSKTVDSSTVSQTITSDADGLSSVTVNPYVLDNKTVDSSTVAQVVTSDEDGLSQVTINPYVLGSLAVNSSTAVQEFTGQYGTVTVNPYVLDSSTVDSSTNSQTLIGQFGEVTINPYVLDSSTLVTTQNGEFVITSSADGLSRVDVSVNIDTQAYYDQGYGVGYYDGEADGIAEQKAKLDSSTLTINGTYTREDGWNEITVEVDTVNNQNKTVDSSTNSQLVTPDQGYTGLGQVVVNPYTLDSSTLEITTNGQYAVTSTADGLSRVDVSVGIDTQSYYDAGYSAGETAGIAEGIAEQKAKLDSSTLTQNGTFTREDGWNSITVDVDIVNNQNKTVDSSTNSQLVTPDQGYTGLGQVTVNPYIVISKTVDASVNAITVTPVENVNYVRKSNAAVYYDLNDYPTVEDEFEIDYYSEYYYQFGNDTDSSPRSGVCIYNNIPRFGNSVYDHPGNVPTGRHTIVLNKNYIVVDSSVFRTATTPATQVETNYTLVAFAVNEGTMNTTLSYDSRIYYIKWYRNGSLYKHFVPIESNNVIVLHELVNDTIISPSTSSYLTLGTDQVQRDGLSSVTVNAVTSSIDANIAAENIKDGVTILGVQGNYSGSTINNQNKTVDSSTNSQSVTYESGYTGLGTVTINAVTSAIDANISAGNIKNGVTILGVQGTYSGTTINNQNKTVDSSTNAQSVTYDSGYTGLGTVTVNPYTTQQKASEDVYTYVSSDSRGAVVRVEPDNNYDALEYFQYRKATILDTKTFDASTGNQTYVTNTANTYVKGINEIVINGLDLDSCYTLAASI